MRLMKIVDDYEACLAEIMASLINVVVVGGNASL